MFSEKAKNMLEKQGWKEGMSLGKNGDGITKAIKVPLKMNTSGLGFQFGKEFTDDWWSSAYNAAAGKVKVSHDDTGMKVNLEKTSHKSAKEGLKSRFKRSGDQPVEDNVVVNDNPMKMIKGITCHKAARHGIRMNGKMERIERQEREHLQSVAAVADEEAPTSKKSKKHRTERDQ